jgi:spermidine synthase
MIILLFSPLFFYTSSQNPKILPDGTKVSEVFSSDSFYGNLKVLDYTYEDKHRRELLIDGFGQSFIDMKNRISVYTYPYFIEFLPYSLNPFGKKCLVIGLGAGIIPMWYEERGIKCDVVDIDPKVVDVAKRYFGFNITGDIIISDARYFLLKSEKKYDYILVDVFSGDVTPSHILSLEAFKLLKEKLTAKGILSFNLIGSIKKETFMTASVIKTLKKVFETVKIYPNSSIESLDGILNITVVAYNHPPINFNPEIVKDFIVHPAVKPLVSEFLGKEFVFAQNTPAILLTDEYNPIDFFDIWVKERIRQRYLEYADMHMLL